MTDTSAIELTQGALRLSVRPDLGGSIAGLWLGEVPVLRSTPGQDLQAPRQSGCYPLVPYSNRIGYRRFRWLGHAHTTQANFDDNPHSVHGVAWLRAWQVLTAQQAAQQWHAGEGHAPASGWAADLQHATASLAYRHQADAHWPFDFQVVQRFELSASHLMVGLQFEALADQPQPVGLGWHPYFPKRSRSRLHMELEARWDSDAAGLPVRRVAQHVIDADVAHLAYDNCFDGWRGPARVRDERLNLRLSSNLPHLVVYTPQDKPYYCVEPVSHVSNAIQMAEPAAHGLRSLSQGQRMSAWMRLDIATV